MTPITLTDRLEGIVDSATSAYLDGLSIEQSRIWKNVSGLIDTLDLTSEGLIKPTAKNLRVITKLDSAINEVFETAGFERRIGNFMGQFGIIGSEQDKYFESIEEAFVPNEGLFRRIEQNAINLTRESLLGAGLDNELITPIEKILNANISSGASFFDVREQVRQFILGGDGRLGRLESYSGQIARDALNQFSRTYHENISQDLGLDWFLYRGGHVADTRPFCAVRAGKYFHRSEIEKWPSQNWKGKIPGTTASTIYVYAGGYNCMHHIVAVHESVVPKSDLSRINKG